MSCLVEVHNEEELTRVLNANVGIIGINNRNLDTFETDIMTTCKLRPLIPPDIIVVSESGINSRDDMHLLKSHVINAVLIGEALVTSNDISSKMKDLFI